MVCKVLDRLMAVLALARVIMAPEDGAVLFPEVITEVPVVTVTAVVLAKAYLSIVS